MTKILGKAVATAEQMAAYLLSVNPAPKINMDPVAFCRLYLYIGALEGVRGDGLFAQSCHETGNFVYTGTVTADQNNYAGLGTTDVNTPGATFPDEATGILAQAQHAKGYEGTPLNYGCVDPRYELLVKYGKAGTAKHWEDLGGSWAVPGYDVKKYASLQEAKDAKDSYGHKIVKILDKILAMPVGGKVDEEVKEEVKEENTMSNSPLVDYVKISPNSTNPRKKKITKITPHHAAGNVSVERMGEMFASPSRKASANYGIDSNGRVGMYVEEKNRPWTSSSAANDNEAVTIEVANDGGAPDWHVSDVTLETLIDLCVDICERNGIEALNFTGDKTGNLTMHKYFTATLCPGPYLESKFPYIEAEVNKRLRGEKEPEQTVKKLYRVRKSWADVSSQLGAYEVLENAKRDCKDGYTVYDWNGVAVYTKAAAEVKVEPAQSFDKSLAGTYKVKASDGLNLRSGAATDKTSLEVMANGSEFRCYGYYTDGWLYGVSASGKTGFCSKTYLAKK